MRGSWWIFVEVTTTVTSMASLTRKPRSKYWFACFRDVNGKQRRRSTGQTDRKKALKVAEQFEQIGRRKLAPRTVRESLAELYREIYGETLPVATVRKFVADWLQTKEPEVSAGTLAFYKKSIAKFLEFLGTAADLDLASITRTTVLEFRNHVAKRSSPVTTNADLKAIKMICRAAKREGYIVEDPAEFVETVRKNSEQARRPFTILEIQRVLSVADAEWKSLILFGLYTGQRLADIATGSLHRFIGSPLRTPLIAVSRKFYFGSWNQWAISKEILLRILRKYFLPSKKRAHEGCPDLKVEVGARLREGEMAERGSFRSIIPHLKTEC